MQGPSPKRSTPSWSAPASPAAGPPRSSPSAASACWCSSAARTSSTSRTTPAARKAPWEYPHRGGRTRELVEALSGPQARLPAQREEPRAGGRTSRSRPTPRSSASTGIRGYQVGGRSLTWGRQSYRHSDLDFEANAKEGIAIDWPIRYADIAPWYDHVERFAGIGGSVEGLPQLPDGQFQPAMPLNVVEKALAGRLSKQFDGTRRIIPGRVANLTEPLGKRGRCQYRNACWLGCPYGAYFSTQSSTLPAAVATGRLTLQGARHRHRRGLRQGPQAGDRRARDRRRTRARRRSTPPRSSSSAPRRSTRRGS